MLILKPIYASAKENTTLQQLLALCARCTRCAARGPKSYPRVRWPSFFNLQLCYCHWASPLCQKGAGGGKAVPESGYLSPLRAVLALCHVPLCRPGCSRGSRALLSPVPAPSRTLASQHKPPSNGSCTATERVVGGTFLWKRREWGCLWHHVALLKWHELLAWTLVVHLVFIRSFLITSFIWGLISSYTVSKISINTETQL